MDSELFVFLDDAQFEKKGWQNRNRIRTKNDTALLSIPVHAHSYPNINEITIDNNKAVTTMAEILNDVTEKEDEFDEELIKEE